MASPPLFSLGSRRSSQRAFTAMNWSAESPIMRLIGLSRPPSYDSAWRSNSAGVTWASSLGAADDVADHEQGPALALVVEAAEIGADDAQHQELHAAQKADGGHQRRPAGQRVAERPADDGVDEEGEADRSHHPADGHRGH